MPDAPRPRATAPARASRATAPGTAPTSTRSRPSRTRKPSARRRAGPASRVRPRRRRAPSSTASSTSGARPRPRRSARPRRSRSSDEAPDEADAEAPVPRRTQGREEARADEGARGLLMFDPTPGLSLSARGAPERSPLEPEEAYARRLAKWRQDNAKTTGQRRALERLDPPPQVLTPRAPWQT